MHCLQRSLGDTSRHLRLFPRWQIWEEYHLPVMCLAIGKVIPYFMPFFFSCGRRRVTLNLTFLLSFRVLFHGRVFLKKAGQTQNNKGLTTPTPLIVINRPVVILQ